MTDDFHAFLFAQHVGLNSPDFIFAFWGSVAWVPLISFYFSGAQPHLGAPQGDLFAFVWKTVFFQTNTFFDNFSETKTFFEHFQILSTLGIVCLFGRWGRHEARE